MVTPKLFSDFPDVCAFADADISAVEEDIRTCGLYKTKARDIIAMCQMLRDEFGGKVPDTLEELDVYKRQGPIGGQILKGNIRIAVNITANSANPFLR